MDKILGFKSNGEPIHELKPGTMATACCISCSACGEGIRGMGGPMRGAKCPGCFQFNTVLDRANVMVLTGDVLPVGIRCVFTHYDSEQETFEMCVEDEANHVSVYLRLPIGEVVPLMDFEVDKDGLKHAQLLVKNAMHSYGVNLEPGGALE